MPAAAPAGNAGKAGAAKHALVQDARPQARIVIAKEPPRMVKLAAEELRDHVEKISGAALAIGDEPDPALPATIYVGRSTHTDRLGVTDEGLTDGAFRMVSGDGWLALVGHDEDFLPRQPFTMAFLPSDPRRIAMLAEWDRLSGGTYESPLHDYNRRYSPQMGLWEGDERGSLNAVHEFLRGLGVRWYMPGPLGEIVPRSPTIPLPVVDRTVRPAFAWRELQIPSFHSAPRDDILWALRQGFTSSKPIGTYSHGLSQVLSRPEMKAAHPEYYALVRGRRLNQPKDWHHACLSSRGLEDEAVRYARACFDVYDLPMVSLMPEDGFLFCECEGCRGLDSPRRGRDGMHSDYVWGFIDRVARRVLETHPTKKINCLAYGTSSLPPEKISKLSPNVVVGTIHGRGRDFDKPAAREKLLAARAAWREKTAQPFWNWEHYPFTHLQTFTPNYFPRSIAEGLRSMRGEFFGEYIELPWGPAQVRGHGLHEPGFNHLNLYVTGRYQWDPDQDLDGLLDEYYRLFYGPAAAEMKAFVEYSATHHPDMQRDKDKIDKALALFDSARAPAGSPYAERLELLGGYLKKLRDWRKELDRSRDGVPVADAPALAAAGCTIDGRLDDACWKSLPEQKLVDLGTGKAPQAGSWFKCFWEGGDKDGHLVFGIHCDEPDMENVRVVTSEDGDWRVLDGDTVEIMLETQSHCYYQLVVNPAGAILNLDRNYGKLNFEWSSLARAAARRGDGSWTAEVRIPVTGVARPADPLHELAGWRPTAAAPWYINVCRQRVRGDDRQLSLWAPPEIVKSGFHDTMRYGRLQ